jgi:predicted DNA-binding protein (MmcQ/YjbR family)
MNIEIFRSYCLSKKGVTEEFPFDKETLVFKVMGKIFVLTDVDLFTSINLKCDPQKAYDLRERYTAILPGYHMNKKHWNTILIDGSLTDQFILELTDHSYDMVVNGLSKSAKMQLQDL